MSIKDLIEIHRWLDRLIGNVLFVPPVLRISGGAFRYIRSESSIIGGGVNKVFEGSGLEFIAN